MSATDVQSVELAIVEHEPRPALATVQVAPQVSAAELVSRLNVIEDAMRTAMKENVDYGVIPGTGTKPTLLKPGAEKLGALFQLDVQLTNDKTWHDDGHLTVVARATVFHQPTGARLGSGEGICTTREAKYAYRNGERVCPNCGKPSIIKGKEEYGGGWVCWKNHKTTPGCGASFPDGSQDIEGQKVEKIPNENIADTYNTVDKMASKRARIDAVLAVTGASALFTQDIEDFSSNGGSGSGGAQAAPVQHARPQTASNGKASEAQAKLVETLIAELHKAGTAAEPEIRDGMTETYGTAVAAELTKAQASDLITRLKAKQAAS